MILAVLLTVGAAQKHSLAAACQKSDYKKRGKVFTQRFSTEQTLTAKGILLFEINKTPWSAKVGLETGTDYSAMLTAIPIRTWQGRIEFYARAGL
jgi:hypothetical protein